MERRIITTEVTEEDKRIEPNLRPQSLNDYIGQEKLKANLKVYIDAAKARGESLDRRDWGRQPYPGSLPMRWA